MSESDSTEEIVGTPPEIRQLAELTTADLLPEKSKTRYEAVYGKFMDWRLKNSIQSVSENVLLAYFGEVSKQFKPTSLWAMYSMLRSVLIVKHNTNIAKYSKLKSFLRRQSDGFRSKKSKILTAAQVNKFIEDAPDFNFLLTKTVLIIGISGACRRQELKNLQMKDVEDLGNKFLINIATSKTKIERSFVISGAFYNVCKRYVDIRRKLTETNINQFFTNYQNGRCTKQVVGINKIGNIPKQIAQYLNLENPSAYTSHCFRRTSATLLVNAGGDLLALKRHGGWRSSAVAESYVDNSLYNQTTTAEKIMGAVATTSSLEQNLDVAIEENNQTVTADKIMETAAATSASLPQNLVFTVEENNNPTTSTTVLSHNASSRPLILKHCQNFTINYNYCTEK